MTSTKILPDEGLADAPYEYELRVKATYTGDTYEDSDYSETVTITNSPIIAVDGDSRDTYDENDNPTGKAKNWIPNQVGETSRGSHHERRP